MEMNEVVKPLRGDQLYRKNERGRGEDGIFSSDRTYALQHGIHEAGVAMIDEARRQICVLLTLLLLFDGPEELLVYFLFLPEHGCKSRTLGTRRDGYRTAQEGSFG